MKILIDNSGYELKNFGDIAMLSATIVRIKKISPSIEIYVFTQQPLRLSEISPDVEAIDIKGRNDWLQSWNLFGSLHHLVPQSLKFHLKKIELFLKVKFPKITYKLIKFRMKNRKQDHYQIRDFLKLINSMDLVMSTGGGFVNDEFPIHAYNVLGTIYLAQKMNKKTAMIGQGLGPITDKGLVSICQKVFPFLDRIGLRESVYSLETALVLGARVDKVTVTGDDAIELAYDLKANFIGKNIGFNLRIAKYSSLNKISINQIKHFIQEIADKRELEILPIAISIHDGDSDIRTLSDILDVEISESQFDSVESVIKAIGQCQLVITGSYHAGVFALSQGIPVVGVAASDYYRQKFDGLKNQFGSDSCYIFDADNLNNSSDLEEIAQNLIDNIHIRRDILLNIAKDQINLSNELLKQIIESSYDQRK